MTQEPLRSETILPYLGDGRWVKLTEGSADIGTHHFDIEYWVAAKREDKCGEVG
jgi:hypothetical protein